MAHRIAIVSALCLLLAGATSAQDRWWYGGGLGLSFGTVDWVELSPTVGYRATDQFHIGGGLLYRYRDDGRFEPSLSTDDYGANLFARYYVTPGLFGHAEYEYLDYEFVNFDLSKDRDQFSSLLAGPGIAQPLGRRASFFAMALYNFSYDSADLFSPYDDEWVYRVGVGIGF